MSEKWLDIVGFEGVYKISSTGRIKSLERVIVDKNGNVRRLKERILKEYKKPDGRPIFVSKKNGKTFTRNICRLMMRHFKPLISDRELVVNHIDGNPSNNAIENLEWCTQAENVRHAYKTGLNNNVGSSSHYAKLDTMQVLAIITMIPHMKQRDIALYFNVSRSCIMHIKNMKSWKFLPRVK